MATAIVEPFSDGHLQEICKVLGEAATGSEISALLAAARLSDPLGPQATKWRRLHAALVERQARDSNANGVCAFVMRAMEPVRFSADPGRFERVREELNVRFAFAGLRLREDGKIAKLQRDYQQAARAIQTVLT